MKKLQCELCGGLDIVKKADNLFVCQHCGCKYTLEQAKTLLSEADDLIIGANELRKELENAETLKKLGEYSRMLKIFDQLIYRFPSELVMWESLLNAVYYIFLHTESYPLQVEPNELDNLQKYFENTMKIATELDKKRIAEEYSNFCKSFISAVLEGKFDIIESFSAHDIFCGDSFNRFVQSFPGARLIYEANEKNTTAIHHAGIYPDCCGHWHVNPERSNKVGYLIGKSYALYDDGNYWVEKCPSPFNILAITENIEEAYQEWNNMDKCPKCGKKLTGFRKRACTSCHTTYNLMKKTKKTVEKETGQK